MPSKIISAQLAQIDKRFMAAQERYRAAELRSIEAQERAADLLQKMDLLRAEAQKLRAASGRSTDNS